MKKLLLSLVAFMLLGVACQTDGGIYSPSNEDLVEITLGVAVPELATRSGETAMNSGLGAIDNFDFDGSEWGSYDVRYILEVYEVTKGYENLDTPIKKREVQTYDKYQETKFELRLVPNRDYRFVVWADFVEQGESSDLHYNTADLKSVTRINTKPVAMDECQDAYFIKRDLSVGTNGLSESLELKRPFGKIRVVTTDHNEVNIGSEPAKVEVKFYNHTLYTSLNAVTGVATGATVNEYTYDITKESSPYTEGYDSEVQNMTLFADYILAGDENEGAQEVNFTMTIWGKDKREIRTHDFNTQIPLERNHLTTIIGNLLTLDNDFVISIDDNFDGEYVVDNLWDGQYEALPAANAEGYIEIETPGQMATLLTMDPEGMKVRLMDDVNFNGAELAIYRDGAKGNNSAFEFDGNGKVISNFTVSEGVSAGLFADLVSANVHDLTIRNGVVAPGAATRASGDFYAGALVGRTYGTCVFNNIKVEGCEIEGVNKVGGLIGNVAENSVKITNCVVESSKVSTQSVDDGGCVAGLVGYVTGNATFENNSVLNTEINAINSANEAKRANAEFIGAFHGNGNTITLSNNTCKDNIFNQAETSYVAPDNFYPWLGGIRYEDGAEVIVDGVSIVAKPLATPEVSAKVDGKVITLTWSAIEGAGSYTVAVGAEQPDSTTEPTYVFTGEYATEYTFTVVAVPADQKYLVSEMATITVTTDDEPVVEPAEVKAYLYPGNEWPSDGAWFAAYFFGNGDTWRPLTLVEGKSDLYEVTVPEGYTNIIFCRMNPASTECSWGNKWNQTNDLVVPTDGKNYFIISNPWDATNTGYWDSEVKIDATLSFTDKANRTLFTTSQQVWEQNGVKLTNDKAKSTNSVADYAKPARFYAKSSITLTAPGNIKTIVFDCNNASYATSLKNSIGNSAAASNDKVTVELDGTTNSFSIASLSAQVRMDAVTVTYVK